MATLSDNEEPIHLNRALQAQNPPENEDSDVEIEEDQEPLVPDNDFVPSIFDGLLPAPKGEIARCIHTHTTKDLQRQQANEVFGFLSDPNADLRMLNNEQTNQGLVINNYCQQALMSPSARAGSTPKRDDDIVCVVLFLCFLYFCICFVLTDLMYLCCLDEDVECRRNLSVGCHNTGLGSTSFFVFCCLLCFVLFFVVFVFCFVVLPERGMKYVGM